MANNVNDSGSLGVRTDAPADVVEDTTSRGMIALLKGIKNYLRTLTAGITATVSGAVTANQGTAGAAAWLVDQTDDATRINGKVDPVTATPTPYNVTCTVADTEYSQALPANCRGFEFQARTEAVLRFAFVTGKVAGSVAPYLTLKAGDYYSSPAINQAASPSTLYVASPTAGTVVELIAWV